MKFSKINNLVGWAVCLIACTVYILTAEAGGSFWDCGEFVSSCFKLQIPHPPGAPMFVLLGRLFIVAFGSNPNTAAQAVNIMSALSSGFTILFLFWTITHFARRIAKVNVDGILSATQAWSIMGAGVVGALAYTFSDSFWYSAVEGEVYAMSSFFTAIVFWAILKWEHQADEPGADKWIVFIFFLMGMSIGVHLLNLLTIPAIVMVYYYKKQSSFNYAELRKWFVRILIGGGVAAVLLGLVLSGSEANEERGIPSDSTLSGLALIGTLLAYGVFYWIESSNKAKKELYGGVYIFLIIGCAITGIVQIAVIQYSIKAAGAFDRIFVNSLGLPFFSGFAFFFILLAVLIWVGLKFANTKGWAYLRLALWCFTFMLIGYSSYLTTMIRSSADPSVDMYNVDNPMSLVGYLGRDQYGDFPLLYGQKFTAEPYDYKQTTTKYQKVKDKYIENGKDGHYVYQPEDKMVLPRVWDASNDQNHADYYAFFLDINKTKEGKYERSPTQADNIKFFIGYQTYWMYLRYFLWNFSGKQNDVQGMFLGNVRDGNWITGIDFIDNIFYGDQSALPDSLKNNKAHNRLFGLPLILGLLGLFFHFKRKGDDAFVNLLLFFFTGMAIVLYLNQAGYQPRERDYAYVGSFYAFAVWIGIGVMCIIDWLSKKMSQTTAAMLGTVVSLMAVPVVMAQQEWDDHDRSKKVLARDLAKDYLESCAPNAILFSFGDNDTYPLWYAQEVEGIRKDVRVINYSLLGIDWYINQLRYKVNNSSPIDVILSAEQIEGRKRDYVVFQANPAFPDTKYYDLYSIMKDYVGKDDADKIQKRSEDDFLNTFPVHKFSVPVDKATVLKNGTVNANDSVVSALNIDVQKNAIMKNDLAVLNILAANKWQRPIYFTSAFGELGFGKYLRKDGLAHRLVPVEGSDINTDWMKDKLLNKFAFGNANVKGVYYDEENRRHLQNIRQAYGDLASHLAAKGNKEAAREVLQKADKSILEENFGYGMVSRGNMHNRTSLMFLDACYRAEDKVLIAKVTAAVKKDLQQQIKYYNTLQGIKGDNMAEEKRMAESYLNAMEQMEQVYNPKTSAPEMGKTIQNNPK